MKSKVHIDGGKMMNYYELRVAGLSRNLPIIQVADNLEIATFSIK